LYGPFSEYIYGNMEKKMTTLANYNDSWKGILDVFLPEFLKLFFPEVYDDIDWSKKPVSLDKELDQITSEAAVGGRVVDKLLEVHRKNGEKALVYIHIEVQSQWCPIPRKGCIFTIVCST